jgi:uncharacterized protein YwqG
MEDRFRTLMCDAGLAKYTEEIFKVAWNSIRIRTQTVADAQLPLGASRIGGQPDLPECCEWPTYTHDISHMIEMDEIMANRPQAEEESEANAEAVQTSESEEEMMSEFAAFIDDFNKKRQAEWEANPVPQPAAPAREPVMGTTPLSFLAQFRMADLAPYDTEGMLPHTGLLYFFYDAVCHPGGFGPNDPNGHRVLYYDGDLGRLRRRPFPDDLREYGRFSSLHVNFRRELTLPGYGSVYLRLLDLCADDEFAYCDEVCRPYLDRGVGDSDEHRETTIHRMLGHPDPDQGDVFLASEMGRGSGTGYDDPGTWKDAGDWRLLFQLASIRRDEAQPEMMWGDLGHLYFCIKKDDLAARDFSKAWLEHQCG